MEAVYRVVCPSVVLFLHSVAWDQPLTSPAGLSARPVSNALLALLLLLVDQDDSGVDAHYVSHRCGDMDFSWYVPCAQERSGVSESGRTVCSVEDSM
jgi:hypothetical protein